MERYISSRDYLQKLSELAKQYRIHLSMTQKELADRTGLSLRSIQNFEAGNDVRLEGFIRILLELGLSHQLNILIPDVMERPSAHIDHVSKRKRVRHAAKNPDRSFVWGDEK